MEEQKITDSSPALEPAPTPRKRTLRTRAIHAVQDDVPHYATSRREPRRAGLALEHARACAQIAVDNRGKDVLLLDLRKTTPIVDFFVIVTATSSSIFSRQKIGPTTHLKRSGAMPRTLT